MFWAARGSAFQGSEGCRKGGCGQDWPGHWRRKRIQERSQFQDFEKVRRAGPGGPAQARAPALLIRQSKAGRPRREMRADQRFQERSQFGGQWILFHNDGTLNIQVTFKLGTNPDIATVQTQNRVSIAMPRLPPEVQQQGVTVKKVSSAFLLAISLVSTGNNYDSLFLTNYAQINLVNQLGNLEGVGESRLGTNQVYSMRVWVNPDRMAKLGITATDVSTAIQAQNRQNPAGAI